MKAILHRSIMKKTPVREMSKKELWTVWAIGGCLAGGLIRMAIYWIFLK